ncbi:o-succinylbenzoate synthase [Microbacterium sp. MYb72]|uniref:o-succinylbenzoate synthase n=1 Tax=Microbacterium sp. MYb72 TaxID=1848693 RepID=UPI000CFCB6C1|nr:o-succinylbenzoate synthase [Microbacterium sp. MYb72]PRB12013.1 o-succinylbenzoate synthase [Microbacterium sp. MYb72]
MKLEGVEILHIAMPLVGAFRTSFGTEAVRETLLLRAVTDEAEGWGESGASEAPLYSGEHTHGVADVLARHLIPALAAAPDLDAHSVAPALSAFKENRLAKAALETAILDADLKARGIPLSYALGAVRRSVASGVSVGIADSIPDLLDTVDGYLADGYLRIKLKIEPGWDVEPVRAVRERFGDIMLQVDANASYERSDIDDLLALDDFDLSLVEQPLPADDLLGHAMLGRRLATPICLDESIVSARAAATAIELGACRIVNIKAGRVGGYLEARRIHDVCAAHGVPVWCGGMLETGVGRAANVALAALPGFTLPGDTSASERYFAEDITEPFRLVDGHLAVPTGPGIGVSPAPDALARFTVSRQWVPVR